MIYNSKVGITVSHIQKFKKQLIIAVAAIFMASFVALTLSASAAPTTFSFTQAELNTNWGPERIAPSGGYSSLATFEGRSNVAEIRINSTLAHPTERYYRTEGIKNPKNLADNFAVGGNFGQSVQVDLYLDPAWNNNAVRAGLWTVGDDGANGTDPASYPFGIIEFANVSGHEGFRYYDPIVDGYVNLAGFNASDYGKWVTFNITLNPTTDQYLYSINGVQVASSESPAISTYLHSVILNQRNFGLDLQARLTNNSYTAHWHGGVPKVVLSSKEDCKNNGWKNSELPVFKNQGQCVSHFASNAKSTNAIGG